MGPNVRDGAPLAVGSLGTLVFLGLALLISGLRPPDLNAWVGVLLFAGVFGAVGGLAAFMLWGAEARDGRVLSFLGFTVLALALGFFGAAGLMLAVADPSPRIGATNLFLSIVTAGAVLVAWLEGLVFKWLEG